ncbi:MAG: PAS domain S-box protein, partial [bacterium]|nr:PAS domain S-box protein [bacterium]
MFYRNKVKKQLKEQLLTLRRRVAKLERLEAQRRKADEEIEQARYDLNQIFNAAVPLCVIAGDHTILRVNDTFCSLFGMEKEQVVGQNCCKVWQGPLCNTADCPLEQILSRGAKLSVYEVDKKLNSGQTISCLITAVPYLELKGEVIGIVENFTDITEHRRTEKELQDYRTRLEEIIAERTAQLTAANKQLEQEIAERRRAEEAAKRAYAELNQIFNAAADGMCLISKDLKIIRVNETFCQMFPMFKLGGGDKPQGKGIEVKDN